MLRGFQLLDPLRGMGAWKGLADSCLLPLLEFGGGHFDFRILETLGICKFIWHIGLRV